VKIETFKISLEHFWMLLNKLTFSLFLLLTTTLLWQRSAVNVTSP